MGDFNKGSQEALDVCMQFTRMSVASDSTRMTEAADERIGGPISSTAWKFLREWESAVETGTGRFNVA